LQKLHLIRGVEMCEEWKKATKLSTHYLGERLAYVPAIGHLHQEARVAKDTDGEARSGCAMMDVGVGAERGFHDPACIMGLLPPLTLAR
jgi:hypothetical protein